MSRPTPSDEAVVERARRALSVKAKGRWILLLNAAFFLGFCGYWTVVAIRKVENLDADKLSEGFLYGLALAFVVTTFGVIGALFLGKALLGFDNDFRNQELLVRYHDRLKELRALPDEKHGEQGTASDGGRASPPGNSGTADSPSSVN